MHAAGRPNLTGSLFFAIFPDGQSVERVAEIAQGLRTQFSLESKPIPTERLHLTLHYLGAFDGLPRPLVEQVKAAAANVALAPAGVTLDHIECFRSNRPKHPIVLSGEASDSLSALEYHLAKSLATAGIEIKRRPHFKPHITLFYAPRHIARHAIKPITWRAKEFTLIHSYLGQSRYETLATWPLNT
jgi:RNA 2',3'-cyclic 3'-phosphodiesterase